MMLFDANVILRYLLNDHQEMAEKAEEYLQADDAAVTIEVVAEVVYVLKGVYSLERRTIAETLTAFLQLVECGEKEVLVRALDIYAKHSLDFVDCVLAAYHRVKGARIATFDQKLMKLIETDE